MNKLKIALAIGILLVLATGSAGHAGAPPLPARFYGAVKLDRVNVPAGTLVSAWIDGVKYAETPTFFADGDSVYLIAGPGDDPDTPEIEGGREGGSLAFRLADTKAYPLTRWFSGTYNRLDLTATTGRDLLVTGVDISAVTTDPQVLTTDGTVKATIRNQGDTDMPADAAFAVTFFEDRDGDSAYDPAADNTLGQATHTGGLAASAEAEVGASVAGQVLFRDNLIYAFVDSENMVVELDETNNLNHTGDPEVVAGNTACRSDGSIYRHNSDLTDSFNAVANFDDDPFPEVVLVAAPAIKRDGGMTS